jgi:hypothetical protein
MSEARFADGLRYRIEIPSVEGPRVLEAVLEEAERRDVPVRRVSQGSGVMMLTDAEIRELAELGAASGVEVSLFLGPRGAWDTGGQSLVTAAAGGVARGRDGVADSIAEVRRGVALGIRSFLVADLGVLKTLGDMRRTGVLPATLVLKTSVLLPCANHPRRALEGSERRPSTSRPTSRRPRSASCAACAALLDVYVEVPDDQGGFVRFYDVPEIVRLRPPVYVKLGSETRRTSILGTPPRRPRCEARPRAGAPSELSCDCSLSARRSSSRAGDDRPPDLGIPELWVCLAWRWLWIPDRR